jgi:hypothetical protein
MAWFVYVSVLDAALSPGLARWLALLRSSVSYRCGAVFVPREFNFHVVGKRSTGVGTQTRPDHNTCNNYSRYGLPGQAADGARGTIGRFRFNGLGWRIN